ncbi:hypothetical protein GQR58_009354 [Nymphon striatum]|nr:hypothetical protein GQR58_009354 [Nymphon striatum]
MRLACTNVWIRDLADYRYLVQKISKCPSQYGEKDPGRLASDEDDWKNQATVSNGQFLEISLRSEQKRTKWPRSKTCEIWTALKNSDGEIPSFLLTENILELHRRLSFQNRFEIYGNLKNYE